MGSSRQLVELTVFDLRVLPLRAPADWNSIPRVNIPLAPEGSGWPTGA